MSVGDRDDLRALSGSVKMVRDDYEGQDHEVLVGEASDIAGAVMHWFGCRDGDAAFGSLIVDQLRRVAEFVHSQPCTCPPDVVETGEVCLRCRALCRVNNKPEEL
jgi:hypothetical protein